MQYSFFTLIGLFNCIFRRAGSFSDDVVGKRYFHNLHHIRCSCIVTFCLHTAGVCKVGFLTADVLGRLIHQSDEGFHIPRYSLAQGVSRVVARGQESCVNQVLYRQNLPLLQVDGSLFLAGCFCRHRDLLIERKVLYCQQYGHQLSNAEWL